MDRETEDIRALQTTSREVSDEETNDTEGKNGGERVALVFILGDALPLASCQATVSLITAGMSRRCGSPVAAENQGQTLPAALAQGQRVE